MHQFRFLLLFWAFCCGVASVLAQGFRTIVPYQSENGKLLTTLVVNGVEGRFLIDTGAPCCLGTDFAQRAGISLNGKVQRGTDSNGQMVESRMLRIDSLRIGRGTLRNVQALLLEKGGVTDIFGVDGILGYNVFRMGIIKFDSRAQHFVFTSRPEGLDLREDCAQPLLNDPYLALIELPLRDPQRNITVLDTVMFDAGALDFYEMSARSYERLKDSPALQHLASAVGTLSMGAAGVEQATMKHRVKIGEVPFADLRFRQLTTITTDATDSRLGTALLNYGDVAIDYPKRKFYFLPFAATQPNNTTATNTTANNTATTANQNTVTTATTTTTQTPRTIDLYTPEWDVVITINPEGHFTAGIVWDEHLPIHAGDRIVAVNGVRYDIPVDVRSATTTATLTMPGTSATLTYIDARTQKENTITIRKQ